MNEESDGINENEINNSEVVILPERSRVEELLLSDQSHIREEQNAYERKLDEKLKDLGLYEEDMTIIQKEELLAVVVISCETAEQEENKRQLIREYLDGAQSLEEEIEFSFQESAWLADEANLLCSSTVTQSKDEDSSSTSKVYASFMDGESSTRGKNSEVFDPVDHTEKIVPRNSPDIFDDEAVYAEISADPQPSGSDIQPKKSAFHRSRSRAVKKGSLTPDTNIKIGVAQHILQEQESKKTEPTEILDRQRQIQSLDKSMGFWKPCMSPKDKPLSNFRLKKEDKHVAAVTPFQEKFNKYLTCFDKTASSLKSKRSSGTKVTLLKKPYVLMHHGNVARKASKLDDYDYTIGVLEKSQNDEEEEEEDKEFMPCNTVTRAKSAFHRVKPISHGRLISFTDHNAQSDGPSKTTRSGATYGSKRLKSETEKPETSSEVVLEGLCDASGEEVLSEKCATPNEDAEDGSARKLPKFSDVKPDIAACKMVVPSFVAPEDGPQTNARVKYNFDSHAGAFEKRVKKEEKIGNKTEKDYSSDSSSSLIDVETVVDEEIEEFVLKRKLPSISQKTSYAKNTSQSKRLKKNDL